MRNPKLAHKNDVITKAKPPRYPPKSQNPHNNLKEEKVIVLYKIPTPRCLNCEAGEFSAAGAEECTACEAGKWSDAGDAVCINCTAGQWRSAENTTGCVFLLLLSWPN